LVKTQRELENMARSAPKTTSGEDAAKSRKTQNNNKDVAKLCEKNSPTQLTSQDCAKYRD
jgi:hypothetical protein